MTDLIDNISTLIKDEDWESIGELEGYTCITSHRGQPECHEILPLLMHGLALNLIFLNVTQDLDSSETVIYRDDGGYSPIQYKSEFIPSEKSSSVPSAALLHSRLVQTTSQQPFLLALI